jgi:hypothetical protein
MKKHTFGFNAPAQPKMSRDLQKEWSYDKKVVAPLNETETKEAVADLVKKSYVQVNRRYEDPAIPRQKFGLFSFIPSAGAQPDEKGFFGFAKIRGVFETEAEAEEHAEGLIRDVDSTNSVFTCIVGRPFPVVTSGFAHDVKEIDLQKEAEKAIAENVKAQRKKEKKKMDEIKDREEMLKKDVSDPDPEDAYVTLRVKLATLKFTTEEHHKKIAECAENMDRTRAEIIELERENPTWYGRCMDKYKKARAESGIPDDQEFSGFMKYILDVVE